MKKSIRLFLVVFALCLVLSACGKAPSSSSSPAAPVSNSLNTSTSGWMAVTIEVPPPGSFGGATSIHVGSDSNKYYLIGSQTNSGIAKYLLALPQGTILHAEIQGDFAKESNHFPNPMAVFDVIGIRAIR